MRIYGWMVKATLAKLNEIIRIKEGTLYLFRGRRRVDGLKRCRTRGGQATH